MFTEVRHDGALAAHATAADSYAAKATDRAAWKVVNRTRDRMMRQRTQVINALRAHLAEFGIVAAQGNQGVKELLAIVADQQDARLPVDARASVIVLAAAA